MKRYDAYDVFLYTLETYAKLPFKEIILNIEMNETGPYSEYYHKREELINFCSTIFFGKKWKIELKRIKTRDEHLEFIASLIEKYGPNEPIYFQTNHNHPFIDFNTDILSEGLELMQNDKTRFKSIAISHFPECIRIVSDAPDRDKIGNFVATRTYKTADTVAIFNLEFIYYYLSNITWHADDFQKYRYRWWEGSLPELDKLIPNGDMKLFAPLREQCRHMDGYNHINLNYSDTPPLVLPKEANIFDNSEVAIKRKMLSCFGNHIYFYGAGNSENVPEEWIQIGINLCKNADKINYI
jgi:hypothetical protein